MESSARDVLARPHTRFPCTGNTPTAVVEGGWYMGGGRSSRILSVVERTHREQYLGGVASLPRIVTLPRP